MAERTMKKWITADVALEEIIKKCGWNPHFEMDYKTVGAICVTVVDDKEMLLNFVPEEDREEFITLYDCAMTTLLDKVDFDFSKWAYKPCDEENLMAMSEELKEKIYIYEENTTKNVKKCVENCILYKNWEYPMYSK